MSKRSKHQDLSLFSSPSGNNKKIKTSEYSFSTPVLMNEELSPSSDSLNDSALLESASLVHMDPLSEIIDDESIKQDHANGSTEITSIQTVTTSKISSSPKKRTGTSKHSWTNEEDNILVSTAAGATKKNQQISWVHALPAFQKSMKDAFDSRLTVTALRKRFRALQQNEEYRAMYNKHEKGGLLKQNLLGSLVIGKIQKAQQTQVESLYDKVITYTCTETAMALITKDKDYKYMPQAVGTQDFFATNVRNLCIYYLDNYGLLDSSSMQKKSLDVLKGLGKIFALEPRLLAMEGIDAGHIGTFLQALKTVGCEIPNEQFLNWFKDMCQERLMVNIEPIILPQDTDFVIEPINQCFGSKSLTELLKWNSVPKIIGIKVEGSSFVGKFCSVCIESVKTSEYGNIGTKTGTYKGFSDHQHKNCRILCEDKLIRKADANHYYVMCRHTKKHEKVSVNTMKKVWGEKFEINLESGSKSSLLYSSTVQDSGKSIRRAHIPFDLKLDKTDEYHQQWVNAEKKLLDLAKPETQLDNDFLLKCMSVLIGLWSADGSHAEPKFFLSHDEDQICEWVINIAKLLFPQYSQPCRLSVFTKVLQKDNAAKNDEDKKFVMTDIEDAMEENSQELKQRFESMVPPRTSHHRWYYFKKEKDFGIIKHVIAIPYGSADETNLLQHGYQRMMNVVWFHHEEWIRTMKEIKALVGTKKHYPHYWYFASKTFSLGFLLGFTYGDGHKEKSKNVFSVCQKDNDALHLLRWYCTQHGMSSSSIYEFNDCFSFRFYGPGLVHFTDEILKKKSKDGDSTSVPRLLSLPVQYDDSPKEEKEMMKLFVLDPSIQFLVTAQGAVYSIHSSTFIHYTNEPKTGFQIIQQSQLFTKAVPSYITDLLKFDGNK